MFRVKVQKSASAVHRYARGRQQSAIRQFLPLLLFLAIIAAGVVGTFLIRWGSSNTADSRLFADTSQFDEWSAIVSFVTAISVPVAVFTWPAFLRVAKRVTKDVGRIAVASAIMTYVLLGAAAVFGPFLVNGGNASFELSYFNARVGVLAALLLTAGAGSFCGLMLLWYSQRSRIDDPSAIRTTIPAILSARRDLQRLFAGAAILITGAVIIIGGLRSALNADINENSVNNAAVIPVGGIILYGIFYALLLAFVLVPAYTAWQARVARFRDRLYPIPENEPLSKDWYEARSNLEDLLGMHLGSTSRFLAAAGILAPLIVSIITAIIPAVHS
jgi:hypothetical protein